MRLIHSKDFLNEKYKRFFDFETGRLNYFGCLIRIKTFRLDAVEACLSEANEESERKPGSL
jgi:hypothetical protein